MKPRPCLLASVLSQLGLPILQKDKSGGVVIEVLILENVSSCAADHTNSFLVLQRSRSGDNREAMVKRIGLPI